MTEKTNYTAFASWNAADALAAAKAEICLLNDTNSRLRLERDKLRKDASRILAALERFNVSDTPHPWAGFENGHGEDVGTELDAAIAAMSKDAGK